MTSAGTNGAANDNCAIAASSEGFLAATALEAGEGLTAADRRRLAEARDADLPLPGHRDASRLRALLWPGGSTGQ